MDGLGALAIEHVGEAHHAFLLVSAAQDDALENQVCLLIHVAQIGKHAGGNCAPPWHTLQFW